MRFLVWLEESSLSLWIVESSFGFPLILAFHSLAMAFLVGVHVVLNFRILGVAPQIPLPLIQRFYPIIWASFAVSLLSGLLLLIAYPAKGLTNAVFYLKMLLIVLAFFLTRLLTLQVVRAEQHSAMIALRHRGMAVASLLLWAAIITAGRFLAYTYTYLTTLDM